MLGFNKYIIALCPDGYEVLEKYPILPLYRGEPLAVCDREIDARCWVAAHIAQSGLNRRRKREIFKQILNSLKINH